MSATLQQRVNAMLAGAGLPPMARAQAPAEPWQSSSSPRLEASYGHAVQSLTVPPKALERSLGLPPPVQPTSTMFLPHSVPKSKAAPARQAASWESPSIRDLLASSVEERKRSAALSASSLRQAGVRQQRGSCSRTGLPFGSGDGSSCGVAIDHSGSRPALVRVSTRSGGGGGLARAGVGRMGPHAEPSLSRSASVGGTLRPLSSGHSPRLLPRDLHAAELSARMPSLAYSHYRPLDIYRGGASPTASLGAVGGVGSGAGIDEGGSSGGGGGSSRGAGGRWRDPMVPAGSVPAAASAPLAASALIAGGEQAQPPRAAAAAAAATAGGSLVIGRPTTAPETAGGRRVDGRRHPSVPGVYGCPAVATLAATASAEQDRHSTREIRDSIAAQMTGLMVGDLFEKVTIREAHAQPLPPTDAGVLDGGGGWNCKDDVGPPDADNQLTATEEGFEPPSHKAVAASPPDKLISSEAASPIASPIEKAASRALVRLGATSPVALEPVALLPTPSPPEPTGPESAACMLSAAFSGGSSGSSGDSGCAALDPATQPAAPREASCSARCDENVATTATLLSPSSSATLPGAGKTWAVSSTIGGFEATRPMTAPGQSPPSAAASGSRRFSTAGRGVSPPRAIACESSSPPPLIGPQGAEAVIAHSSAPTDSRARHDGTAAVKDGASEGAAGAPSHPAPAPARSAAPAAPATATRDLGAEARAAVQKLAGSHGLQRRRAHCQPSRSAISAAPAVSAAAGAPAAAAGAPAAAPGVLLTSGKSRLRGLLAKSMGTAVARTGKGNALGRGMMLINGRVMPVNLATIAMTHLRSRAVAAALRRAPCFAALSEVQLSMLSAGGEERRVPRYSSLYREGSEARSFYVLLSGRLEHANLTSGTRHEISAPLPNTNVGVCFGVEGLTGGLRRLTTVTAVEDATLLHFSTHGMLLDDSGAAALAGKVFARLVSEVLRNSPLFAQAAQAAVALDALAALFKLEEVAEAGEAIFVEGGAADKLYVLLEGSVALYAGDALVAMLPEEGQTDGAPPLFGENAVLSTDAHTLTARTLTAAKLLCLPRTKFPHLLHLRPDLQGDLRRHSMLRKSAKQPASSGPGGGGGSGGGGRTIAPAAAEANAQEAESEARAATLMAAIARGRSARKEVQQMREEALRQSAQLK